MIRLFILIVQIISFGIVTLGTSSTTISSIESMTPITFQDYLDSQHYEKEITLTNLIQNGQMDGNIDFWPDFNSTSIYDNGLAKVIATAPYGGLRQLYVFTSGWNYYGKLDYITSNENQKVCGGKGYAFSSNGTGVLTTVSSVYTVNSSGSDGMTNVLDFNLSNWEYFWIDNVTFFANIGSLTKTQIDTALENYGYLPYNVTTSMYDETDIDFQTLYTDFFGSYSDFELTDLDEVRYISYETTLNDTISLLDIVLLLCGLFVWYCIIKAVGGLL